MKASFTVFNSKKIRYYTEGHASHCVVLLHGFLESSLIWEDFSAVFSKSYKVICVDLAGHGESESLAEVNSMNLMADAVVSVLREEKVKSAIVLGHSMGGYVALALADRYSEFCKGMVLLNSTVFADSEEKKADRLRAIRVLEMNPRVFISEAIPNLFAKQNLHLFIEEIELIKKLALLTSTQGAAACLRGMREREDKRSVLSKGRFPVMVLAGKYDNVVPEEKSKEMFGSGTRVQGVILTNSGHMSFIEERDACIHHLSDFFNEVFSIPDNR